MFINRKDHPPERRLMTLRAVASALGRDPTTREFWEACADPAHPGHSAFTWDDTAAGAAYRDIQAQDYLRIDIQVEPAETTEIEVKPIVTRGTVHNPDNEMRITTDPDVVRKVRIQECARLLRGALSVAREIETRWGVGWAAKSLLPQLEKVSGMANAAERKLS